MAGPRCCGSATRPGRAAAGPRHRPGCGARRHHHPMTLTLTQEQDGLRRRGPRLLPARVRHPRAARRADRRRAAPAQPRPLQEDGRARLARRRDRPRSTAAPAAAWSTCACSSRRPRAGMAPVGGFGVTLDRRRRVRALRHRGAEAGDPRRHRRRRGRGDRDVRARGRLRRRRAAAARPSAQNGGYVINGQKTWISEAHLADHILLVCRTDSSGSKHEGLTMLSVPVGADGHGDPRRSRRWAARSSTTSSSPTATSTPTRLLGTEGQALDAAHGRAERRAADPRRADARRRAARVRRHARLRQGAQAVRPADRLVPGAQAPASPTSRPRSSAAACSPTTSPRASTPNPGAMFPREASMAKLKVTETAKQVALEGMQMMGGYGYATEYDMEGHVRHDARLDDLRRHERDPARHHRQDVRAVNPLRPARRRVACWRGRASLRSGCPPPDASSASREGRRASGTARWRARWRERAALRRPRSASIDERGDGHRSPSCTGARTRSRTRSPRAGSARATASACSCRDSPLLRRDASSRARSSGADLLLLNTAFSRAAAARRARARGRRARSSTTRSSPPSPPRRPARRRVVAWSDGGAGDAQLLDELVAGASDAEPRRAGRAGPADPADVGDDRHAEGRAPRRPSRRPTRSSAFLDRVPVRAGRTPLRRRAAVPRVGLRAHGARADARRARSSCAGASTPRQTLRDDRPRAAPTRVAMVPVMAQRILDLPEDVRAKLRHVVAADRRVRRLGDPRRPRRALHGRVRRRRLQRVRLDRGRDGLDRHARRTCAPTRTPRAGRCRASWSSCSTTTAATVPRRASPGASSSAASPRSRATRAAAARRSSTG